MANLTRSTTTILDGASASKTVETYVDPNNGNATGAIVAVMLADGSLLALGQAAAAGSVPVVLTAAQQAALTPPASVGLSSQVGAANLATGQVTADTTAGGVAVCAARPTRRLVTLTNLGTTDVFVGTGTVTAATGALLAGVKGATLTLGVTGAVKAVTAGGTQAVSYAEEYE